MPRSKPAPTGGGNGTTTLSTEILRSVSNIPGLPTPLLSSLQAVCSQIKLGEVSRNTIVQSCLLESLVSSLESDYKSDNPGDLLTGKQRVLKMRLLAEICGALSPDLVDITASVLNMVCRVLGERGKGEESLVALGVLAILLLRVPGLVVERLG
jgi:hypothetical protein